ncbi:MAG: hypothetical protein IPN76_19980 [Saprospiraceae bacterium]|nr:hypothetical protein [Saprospiraceae bacterium]
MQNTLVFEIIAQFSKTEQRDVRNFLASPFFNQRQDVRQLFDFLAKQQEPPSREAAWDAAQPGLPFDAQQFRLELSYLFKLLEEYLVQKERQWEPLNDSHLLLSAYRRLKLPRHFEKTQKAISKRFENQPIRNPEFYYERFLVEMQQYAHMLESGRTKELNLQTVEDQLTTAMIAMKLRQACLIKAHQAVYNTQYRLTFVDAVLAYASEQAYRNEPAVMLYRLCYVALFSEGGDGQFKPFKAALFKHGGNFPVGEVRSLYLLAINFCIKKINANQHRYLQEALDLYKQGLKTGLLLENGQLSHFAYNNITGIALRLPEEWQWAEEFVEAYRSYLEPSAQEAAFSLNSARLAFAKKRFDEALLYLQRADYKDFINGMAARILQMKIYFEKQELELLDAHLRTLRMFIRRNKRMGYHHQNWSNIVHFTQKLLDLNPFDEGQRSALRTAIAGEVVLTEKDWLLAQLE